MKHFVLPVFFVCLLSFFSCGAVYSADKKPSQEFYDIQVYHFKTAEQEKGLDDYLKQAFIPALHKLGSEKIGVFKPLANDTAADKLIYIFIPLKSFDQLMSLPSKLVADAAYTTAGSSFLDAAYNAPAFTRMESIFLKAFTTAPFMQMPALTGSHADYVYELRSYESPSEKLHVNKVQMFNEGGEVPLFKRLGFNAIFYADVITGSHMPNLMYMTSFNNMASREEHWKSFTSDAEWKKLSAMPQYQHNVSKAEVILLHATDYSDI